MTQLRRLLALAFVLLFIGVAMATQSNLFSPTTGTVSGLTLTQNYNNALTAVNSCNSGGSAPANDQSLAAVKGQCWLDTTSSTLSIVKVYDGVSTWLARGVIDSTNHIWTAPIGGAVATTIASATATDLWSVKQSVVSVSGVTTITSLASASATVGTIKVVTFTGILTLTHNATSLIIPGGANITTAAGDVMIVRAITSTNVAVVAYTKASGLPVIPLASITAHTILSNITGGAAVPSANTWTALLDAECGSTRGMFAYRNATVWTCLAAGTTGQLLQTNSTTGDPAWASVSAPVLLATLTASNSATLADTTSLTSTYPRYEIVFTNILPATASVDCRLRVNSGGVKTTGYTGTTAAWVAGAAAAPNTTTTFVSCDRGGTVLSNTTAGINASFIVTNPSQTASPKLIFGHGSYRDATSAERIGAFTSAGGWDGGNGAVTGIEVSMSSGNITSGTVKIYGLP